MSLPVTLYHFIATLVENFPFVFLQINSMVAFSIKLFPIFSEAYEFIYYY